MFPIDLIVTNALNGRRQRITTEEALAIGAAVRAMASLVEGNADAREMFKRSYSTTAVEALARLTTHTN